MATVFEEKNISKAVLRIGLPAMLGQLTTLIYNIADTYFVSLTKEPAIADISPRTYCRKSPEAVKALSSILLGHTSKDCLEMLDKFFHKNHQ